MGCDCGSIPKNWKWLKFKKKEKVSLLFFGESR